MQYRILSGLPAAGPFPEQFSRTGRGTHREGFVVEFTPAPGQSWVGNFQPGYPNFSAVLPHVDERSLVVIAGGDAFRVDPESKQLIEFLGEGIYGAIRAESPALLILSDGICLEAWDRQGLRWRSERISWDGIFNLQIEGETIMGICWNASDENDGDFSVCLRTGQLTGGCYQ